MINDTFVLFSKDNDGFLTKDNKWGSLYEAAHYTMQEVLKNPPSKHSADAKWISYSDAKKKHS